MHDLGLRGDRLEVPIVERCVTPGVPEPIRVDVVHPIDVLDQVALGGAEPRGEEDCGEIGGPAAEGHRLAVFEADRLEAAHDGDHLGSEEVEDRRERQVEEFPAAVVTARDQAGLPPTEGTGGAAAGRDGGGEEGGGEVFAGGQHPVLLTVRGPRSEVRGARVHRTILVRAPDLGPRTSDFLDG